jgi:hypothetical protein
VNNGKFIRVFNIFLTLSVPENADEITQTGRIETGRDNMISPIREALGGAVSLRLAILIIKAMSHTGIDIKSF